MSKSSDDITAEDQHPRQAIADAVTALAEGQPVLVHDAADRESEVDLIYPATAIDPAAVGRLRNDAGGLICVALGAAVCDAFDLPFLADAIEHPAVGGTPGYDDRSSFSLSVNHRETFTGVTDDDRTLTITALGAAASDPESADFAATFHVPGHVHLLRGAVGGLAERQGHTELGLALAAAAGIAPAVVVCEMLDDETGGALSIAKARQYARNHGFPFVEGSAIVSQFAETKS